MRAKGRTAETVETLYLRAHDLKGLGGHLRIPPITRLAASLCRLIDDPETAPERADVPGRRPHRRHQGLYVRDDIEVDTHPVGKVLAAELEGRVAEYLAG